MSLALARRLGPAAGLWEGIYVSLDSRVCGIYSAHRQRHGVRAARARRWEADNDSVWQPWFLDDAWNDRRGLDARKQWRNDARAERLAQPKGDANVQR